MSTDSEAAVLEYIRQLGRHNFYGYLACKFENGKVVHLRQEENLKPNELPGKTRGEYASNIGH